MNWVSVDDKRIPSDKVCVCAHIKNGKILAAHFNTTPARAGDIMPTHWVYLPELPK